jgi:hypothetical protein
VAKLNNNPHFQGQTGASGHYDEVETMQNALESSDKAKGDLLVYDGAADTYPDALSVGADGTFLKALDAQTLGMIFAAITEADISDLEHAITVKLNSGADIGTRPLFNFIEGSNVTLTVADNPGSNRIDITINASGGAGSTTGWYFIATVNSPQVAKDRADQVLDGTDDHVQINAALQSHYYVVLFEGTYDIGAPIVIRSGGTLAGSGWNTILKANGITTGNRAVVTNDTNAHNCTAPSGTPMFGSPDSAHRCDNLLVVKCDGSGSTYGGILFDSSTGNNRSNWIIGCYMRENGGFNVEWDGSSDNMLIGCHFGGCNGDGIIAGGGNSYIWSSKQFFADGIGLSCTSSRVLVVGFSAQDNGTHGISFTAGDPYGIGLQSDTNGRLGAGSGIYLTGSGARLDFNSFDRGGTPRQDWGVQLSGSPAYLNLTGITKNNQSGHHTGAVGANPLIAVVQYGTTPWVVGY